jgi:hypothetical protein
VCRFSDKAVERLVQQAGRHFVKACSTSCGIEVGVGSCGLLIAIAIGIGGFLGGGKVAGLYVRHAHSGPFGGV